MAPGDGESGGQSAATGKGRKRRAKGAAPETTRAAVVRLGLQRELAEALGVTEKTVSLWVRRADWPAGTRPPWSERDVETITQWRATLRADRANPHDPRRLLERDVDAALKEERRKAIRQKRLIEKGRLVPRSLLHGAMESLAQVFVQCFEELEQSLPPVVAGKDPGQVEKILHDRLRAYRQRLSETRTLELQRVEDTLESERKAKQRGRTRGRQ